MKLRSLITAAVSAVFLCTFATASQAADSIESIMADYELFLLQDDSGEILINTSEGDTIEGAFDGTNTSADTFLDVGDTLFGYASFPGIIDNNGPAQSASLDGVDGNTLYAVFAVEVESIVDADNDGIAEVITFTYSTEFNTLYSVDGAAGTSTIIFFEDASDDLNVGSGGTPWNECTSLADCDGKVTDGTQVLEIGFDGDPDEFWQATNSPLDVSALEDISNSTSVGSFQFGLSTTFSSIGDFAEIINSPLGGQVEWLGSGSVLGIDDGTGSPVTTVFDATDDTDILAFRIQIPEPTTLGMLSIGVIALGLVFGWRRREDNAA